MQHETVQALRAELTALKSIEQSAARGMPGGFYTSPDFLALEEEHVFRRRWACLCHVGEIPKPGDFLTLDLVGEMLLVVRGGDGEIRVLSNVCRHRGNQVETEPRGTRKRFRCAYHNWAYGLEGELAVAPLMKGSAAFRREACDLPRFRTEIWENFLFVNLDGNAPPLGPQMAGMSALMKNYHHEERHLVYMTEDVWETNWKSLVENFLEGYHLSATHLKTLHPITPTRLCKKIPPGPGYTGYHSFYDPDAPERGPMHADMTTDERRNSILAGAFPNLVFSIATNFTLFMCLRPQGTDRVAIRWGLAGYGDDPDDPGVREYAALCHAFNAEDREKLETLRRALRSRYYTPGPLAPDDYEGTIWDFQLWLAERLGADVAL